MVQQFYFCILILIGIIFSSFFVDGSPFKTENPVNKRVQKFYYNETWNKCLAFVHTETKTNSCGVYDSPSYCPYRMDTLCDGPNSAKLPVYKDLNLPWINHYEDYGCKYASCPEGYTCDSTETTLCCENEQFYALKAARSKTCPNGNKAAELEGWSIFGETCEALICAEDEECVQINTFFAKCCEKKSSHIPFTQH